MAKVLIIGGRGYIGSHIAKVLFDAKVAFTSVDIEECDIRDPKAIERCLIEFRPTHVIHLAGLKSVAESILQPERYYQTNVQGTKNLITAMEKHQVKHLIFSSSATVYKNETSEESELEAINPYGETKIQAEQIIRRSKLNYAILRYFNPIGSFPGLNENLSSPNLFPRCIASLKSHEPITIYGNCTRDYVFVGDLARFHLELIREGFDHLILNFGTGRGMTTQEFIETFERVNRISLLKQYANKRPGDKDVCVADVDRLNTLFPDFNLTDRDRWFMIN